VRLEGAGLDARVAQFIEAMPAALAAAFDKELGALALKAFAAWPVSSGLSKSLLALTYYQRDDGTFGGRLVQGAPYAFLINGGETVRDLIFAPGVGISARMVPIFKQAYGAGAAEAKRG
jgi:hypothetical protein